MSAAPRKRTKKVESPRYRVLRDTNEHDGHGWIFEESSCCAGTQERNLFTGDYSIELVEGERVFNYYEQKLFVIERKGSVAEFVANITQKEKWADFKDELGRLEEFRYPFIVCEFPFSLLKCYPRGSGIPRHIWPRLKARPEFLLQRMEEILLRFRSRFLFTDSQALGREVASGLFKRIVENVPAQAA